jgi:hypothetical protein
MTYLVVCLPIFYKVGKFNECVGIYILSPAYPLILISAGLYSPANLATYHPPSTPYDIPIPSYIIAITLTA